MFQDICFPKGNEREFVEIARRLGTKSLVFVYYFNDQKSLEEKKKEVQAFADFRIDVGVLVDEKNINKIHVNDEFVFSKNPSKSLIENKKTYILYDFETGEKPDFLHHRNSGLNQVLCELIKKKEKMVGISFSIILNAQKQGIMLGRMAQNARFLRKYKLDKVVASFASTPYELRAEHEIRSFEKILGL